MKRLHVRGARGGRPLGGLARVAVLAVLAVSAPAAAQDAPRDSSDEEPRGPEAQVRFVFEADTPGTSLVLVRRARYRRHTAVAQGLSPATWGAIARVPRAHRRRLCTSPCSGTLPPGIHTFGLTHPSGDVWVALPPLSLRPDEPLRIEGHLHDHAGDRLGGWLFLILGGLAGLGGSGGGIAMMLESQDVFGTTLGTAGLGLLVGGGTLALLATAVGLSLAFSWDRAWVVGFPLQDGG